MVQFRASHMPMNYGDMEKALGFTVGFDSMFDRLFGALDHPNPNPKNSQGYPPYNIRKDGDTKYFIEMAVAGFSEEDVNVSVKENNLTITGELSDKDNGFVHQGISQRKFARNFVLAEDVLVKGADLSNGILTVYAERIIPEEKRARIVEIGKVSKTTKKQFLAE